MNFLAHIYLSGDNSEIIIGNFIADFVKGNKKENYPPLIKKGISLHRMIDDFTDHHPITLQSQQRIRESQGKYSGVVIDLFYDHFLAKNFSEYTHRNLKEFSKSTYVLLNNYWDILPVDVHTFLPFMIEKNWLLNYATVKGINQALTGLSKRVAFANKMDMAVHDLKQHYTYIENDFRIFFPSLIEKANSFITEI